MDRKTEKKRQLASLPSVITFDKYLYADSNHYLDSIPVTADELEDDDNSKNNNELVALKLSSYTAPKSIFKEILMLPGGEEDTIRMRRKSRIIDREDEYRIRRLNREISPERHDPFSGDGEKTPDQSVTTYADRMREKRDVKKIKEVTVYADRMRERDAKQTKEVRRKRNHWDDERPKRQRSRWDDEQTPESMVELAGDTPVGGADLATPMAGDLLN